MPLYDVDLLDGRKIRIDADDEAAASEGAKYWLGLNPTPDMSFGSALQAGAANVLKGTGQSLRYLGAEGAGSTVEGWGEAAAPQNYRPAAAEAASPPADATKMSDTPLIGQWLPEYSWRGLARSVAEGAPGFALDLAAGGLAGPVGVLGSHALQTFGPTAKETAVKRTGDASAEPTSQDKLIGAGTAALQAGAQVLPVNKVLGGVVSGTGARGVAQAVARTAEAGVAGAAAGAGQEAIRQVGTSLTTPGGPSMDPEDLKLAAVTGGLTTAGARATRVPGEALNSVRYRGMDGDLREASAAVANRITTAADGANLAKPKRAYEAVTAVRSDVLGELGRRADTVRQDRVLSPEAENALDRASKGRALTDRDIAAVEQHAGPGLADLAKQATVLQKLMELGRFDDTKQRFAGGITEGVRTLATIAGRHPYVSGGVGGFAALQASSLGSLLAEPVSAAKMAAAGAGLYGATRATDAALGLRSPAQTFVKKFADPSVPVRPPSPPPAPPVSPKAPPGPPRRLPPTDAMQIAHAEGVLRAHASRRLAAEAELRKALALSAPVSDGRQSFVIPTPDRFLIYNYRPH